MILCDIVNPGSTQRSLLCCLSCFILYFFPWLLPVLMCLTLLNIFCLKPKVAYVCWFVLQFWNHDETTYIKNRKNQSCKFVIELVSHTTDKYYELMGFRTNNIFGWWGELCVFCLSLKKKNKFLNGMVTSVQRSLWGYDI